MFRTSGKGCIIVAMLISLSFFTPIFLSAQSSTSVVYEFGETMVFPARDSFRFLCKLARIA